MSIHVYICIYIYIYIYIHIYIYIYICTNISVVRLGSKLTYRTCCLFSRPFPPSLGPTFAHRRVGFSTSGLFLVCFVWPPAFGLLLRKLPANTSKLQTITGKLPAITAKLPAKTRQITCKILAITIKLPAITNKLPAITFPPYLGPAFLHRHIVFATFSTSTNSAI